MLVAHLAEHKKAVNQIAVAANGAFFATASSDETVKIWDCRRLEKDVTFRSRLTYASQVQNPRLTLETPREILTAVIGLAGQDMRMTPSVERCQ